MCGIIGIFGHNEAESIALKGLSIMENRGKDDSDSFVLENNCVGHNLHAIVDLVKQPLTLDHYTFVANCEIYNWEELNTKYSLEAKNDADLLLRLLVHKGKDNIVSTLDELDGVYAFCLYDTKEKEVYLGRDILGVKPLWYSFSSFLSFASEKKALLKNGIMDVIELNPRKIIQYNIEKQKLHYLSRDFFDVLPEHEHEEEIIEQLERLLESAVKKRITHQKVGVLFSGGIDSVYVAYLLKKMNVDFICYTAALKEGGMDEADDLIWARKAAKLLDLDLKEITVDLEETENVIKEIIPLIESTNVVKVGVALPFYLCAKAAHEDGARVLFSGLGSEEIFAGYERHAGVGSSNINLECLSGLRKMYERDLYRDDVVTMANTIELRVPFLDKKLVDYALKIPGHLKLNDEQKKIILRKVAEKIGIPHELSWRKKKAAQYGSKFDRGIEKLAKKNGYKLKAEYLNSFSEEHNLRLGVLWSTGKDSSYAAYLMQKHHYQLTCLLSIESKNQYSYMFHTPNIGLASLQAEACGLPLVTVETKGEEEIEIEDLKTLLSKGKDEYNIDGVITGALFSSYQRERIEKAADELGLKVFSPLWHKNQEEEMRELMHQGFSIMFSSVAAEGLDETWLGRVLADEDVDKLVDLNEKIGLNVAGEGGEFESLVVDCPLFSKKINVLESSIEKEGSLNAFYVIKKAELVNKNK